VVTGTTAGGLDPATAVSTPHSADSIAVTPDGSAVVADTADPSLPVFSRAAGGPFSAPRTYKIADLAETEQPRIALQDGRATIVYTVHPLQYDSHLADLEALTFDAGTRPGTPLPLPVASSNVTQFAAGPGAAYAITFRAAVLDGTKRSQVEAFTLQPGAGTVPAGVKVSVPRRQSLTLRVTVRCPGPCGVRATDPDTHDGVYYDSSRAFTRAGTHTLRIRVAAGNGFGYPHHVTLRIGVDTPDGQIEATRAVHVR
jgi:hypothetical protein